MEVRHPAVAGVFYPDNPHLLSQAVDRYLSDNPCSGPPPKVLVVPHAGYVYSGPVAARGYNLVAPVAGRIRRVVLLGPSHRFPLQGMALPGVDCFETPLGEVQIDNLLSYSLEGLPQVSVLSPCHAAEHSLEVQLPFLQRLIPQFKLLPLLVGQCPPRQVAEALEMVWGGDETLIVISTDLSHYHPYDEAQQIDRQTSHGICACRSDLAGDEACGCAPLNGMLLLARELGLQVELLDLRNSGDTGGERDRVVGYGAYALY
ncbi:AmmeMemoRadiSam system protein B [Motiliproteus sediminis]|uniref:AmmeMemoRadiSam system protein B n=1 Tax=Motiliproteus sediminis TaxID=1468178 RepID=UPI001AF02113|nr:AmmeMemoRadiSam system protein B [Motiliproteus sediminis]